MAKRKYSIYPGDDLEAQTREAAAAGFSRIRFVRPQAFPLNLALLDKLKILSAEGGGLTELPANIGKLTRLRYLELGGNKLSQLPAEFSQLAELTTLNLSSNSFSAIPESLCDLPNLSSLALSGNRFKSFSASFSKLSNLRDLRLAAAGLDELPEAICHLPSLRTLRFKGNKATTLPPSIGRLTKLRWIDLRDNPISELPTELGRCETLTDIKLTDPGKLRFPPSDIAELGTAAILRYLRAADTSSERVWESKLLLVGEGAVGKTWLYEALNGRHSGGHKKGDGATIGIEIGPLVLPHPSDSAINMKLNCWDFAGQDINHATHQFFFSQRTLFLLCWNARAGWEAGKLRKWLTNIRDRAPQAKVILVSTHCDQPHSDYPEKELRTEFPQILETFKVSSETGLGIEELRAAIALHSSSLPMMGLRWPTSWRAAQQAVFQLREKGSYALTAHVMEAAQACGLNEGEARVLLQWLHELGEVLHYSDADDLSELVMLDPQWVTMQVGVVLASPEVQAAKGLLTKGYIDALWPSLDSFVRQHLLGMMERFDLAYRIPDDPHHRCLIVERLPQNPPEFESSWEAFNGMPEIRLKYRLKSLHPGIPTWFIARCHRFTLGLHWLRGVLFGDNRKSPRHLALVVANEGDRAVTFAVRGPHPWSFLPLLTDGFEDTVFRRYPGLEVERVVPCPGKKRDKSACDFEFNLRDLEDLRWPSDSAIEAEHHVRCTRCRTSLDIDMLLLGLSRGPSRDENMLNELLNTVKSEGEKTRALLSEEISEARRYVQLAFIQEWNEAQQLEEQSCPTVFALYPIDGKTLFRTSRVRLQLYCMNPSCWHSIEPPRDLRRLISLRGLSHEEVTQVSTRSPRAGCAHGARAPG